MHLSASLHGSSAAHFSQSQVVGLNGLPEVSRLLALVPSDTSQLPAATLLAGPTYQDAALPLAIMSISLALACQVRALSAIFVVMKKNVTSALVTIGSVMCPVLLGIVIIRFLGVVGASILRGVSLILLLVFSVAVLRRILRFRFDMDAYVRSWIASVLMGVTWVVEFLYYSPRLLPIYVIVGGVTFAILLKLFKAVTHEDLNLTYDYAGLIFKPLVELLEKWFD